MTPHPPTHRASGESQSTTTTSEIAPVTTARFIGTRNQRSNSASVEWRVWILEPLDHRRLPVDGMYNGNAWTRARYRNHTEPERGADGARGLTSSSMDLVHHGERHQDVPTITHREVDQVFQVIHRRGGDPGCATPVYLDRAVHDQRGGPACSTISKSRTLFCQSRSSSTSKCGSVTLRTDHHPRKRSPPYRKHHRRGVIFDPCIEPFAARQNFAASTASDNCTAQATSFDFAQDETLPAFQIYPLA